MARPRQQSRGGLGLLLLASQIMQIGTDRIPPVTLLTVALNTAIYMRLWPGLPQVHAACTSNNAVFTEKQWMRLIFSSFFHLDDMHLYYNMISFIWKGITLERELGKRKFVILLAIFSIATQLTMLGLNQALANAFSNRQYLYTCAAGFSAVIFALKVLTTASSSGNERIMGLPITVPSRYVCWVELVVIQLLVPNASFTGHLAGILVGLMYIYGPLKILVNLLSKLTQAPDFTGQARQPSYQYQRGTTGTSRRQQADPPMAPQNGYDENDEELQRAIRDSLRQQQREQQQQQQQQQQQRTPQHSQSPGYGWNIPDDTNARPPYPDNINARTPYPDPPTNNRSNLYPDLAGHATYAPSAPPAEPVNDDRNHNSNLPYPPQDNWDIPSNRAPYPTNNEDITSRRPLSDKRTEERESDDIGYQDRDEIRKARLRRFNKN